MTAAGGYPGPGGPSGPGAHEAPSGGADGLAAEVHTLERAIFEVKRIIVGQDQLVERMLVGLLSKGHVLLEGVPGVAKTLADAVGYSPTPRVVISRRNGPRLLFRFIARTGPIEL